ncbi:10969_t:CDS:2 [Racocetra fulgida]|uniref:10969_t:CDS:1 n=1 Tax=Racocetra fulgida TaxID=60492 RepID=A0A9N9ELX6_9GLOM|nr:10969_t:CDS:2 [Racocetra fulgida]
MPTIKLNCLIYGDTPDVVNIFLVEIDIEATFKLQNVNESNEKLNILFDDSNTNIKKKLEGKILAEMDKIFKYFPHKLNKNYIHIIIELPGYHLTFKSYTKRKELVPIDKIIFKGDSFELESEIVCTDIGIQIKFINKSKELLLDSFSKFIEAVKEVCELDSEKEINVIGQFTMQNLIGCVTVTKYCSLSTDNSEHLLDYVFSQISNKNSVPENPNRLYETNITVSGFNTSLSGNSNNIIKVIFDPPRKIFALPVYGINGQPFSALGDSDSPVVNKDNQVVGILHGGVNGESDAYIISIHIIKEHVKKSHKVEFKLI